VKPNNASAKPTATTTPSLDISRPVCPEGVKPLSTADRVALFGRFDFEAAPLPGDKEHVRVLGDWAKRNIRGARLPAFGGRAARVVGVHTKLVERVESLFQVLAENDLLGDIVSWNGAYNPRFIRGSTTRLSNHAWGSAFDISAAQNPLGKPGATWGQPGCVWRIVPIALAHGLYWGGWFHSRLDDQHFEAFR
jgi:hypothetical protein